MSKKYKITLQIFGYNRDCVDYLEVYIPLTSLGCYYNKPDDLYEDYVCKDDRDRAYEDFLTKRICSPRGNEIFVQSKNGNKQDYTLATILNYEEVTDE